MLSTLTSAQIVAIFNANSAKTVKKFETRAIAEARVLKTLDAAGVSLEDAMIAAGFEAEPKVITLSGADADADADGTDADDGNERDTFVPHPDEDIALDHDAHVVAYEAALQNEQSAESIAKRNASRLAAVPALPTFEATGRAVLRSATADGRICRHAGFRESHFCRFMADCVASGIATEAPDGGYLLTDFGLKVIAGLPEVAADEAAVVKGWNNDWQMPDAPKTGRHRAEAKKAAGALGLTGKKLELFNLMTREGGVSEKEGCAALGWAACGATLIRICAAAIDAGMTIEKPKGADNRTRYIIRAAQIALAA